jgi:hypothetical protein
LFKALVRILLLIASVRFAMAELKIGDKTTIAFATVEQAQSILTNRDDFIRRLSPFDRSARLKTDKQISEQDFLKFVASNARPFNESEKNLLTVSYARLQQKLEIFDLPWPDSIFLIHTTGDEEGDAAYTRGKSIILPTSRLRPSEADALPNLLCHELFHVLSRNNPALREKLYLTIGFNKCSELAFPSDLMRITNPDAPVNDHCISLTHTGRQIWAVPILYAETKTYDPKRGGEFFNYLTFKLLAVQRNEDALAYDPQNLQLLTPDQVTGFYDQVGRNTEYIIHPEEILADNFVLLINGGKNAPTPELLAKLKAVFISPKQYPIE